MTKFGSLCVLLLIFNEASSLSCNHCNDESGWDSCHKKVQVGKCDPIITTDLHRNLQNLNPNLPVIPPPGIGAHFYRCYKLEIKFKIAQGSSSVMYEQGCTYYQADFCAGWDMNALEQVNCTTTEQGVPDVDDGGTENSKGGSEQLSGLFCGWLMVVLLIVSKHYLQ